MVTGKSVLEKSTLEKSAYVYKRIRKSALGKKRTNLVLRCTGDHCSLQGAQVQPHLPVVRAGHPKNSFFGWLTGLWHSPTAL